MTQKKEAVLQTAAITQYLDGEYWRWPDAWKAVMPTLTAEQVLEQIVRLLEYTGEVRVEAAYAIVHDKDEREVYDELKKVMVTALKPRHVHVVLRFEKGMGATLSQVAGMVGIEEQYVEKPKRGRYAYDNMLSYLCHCKYPDKHHYAPDEVATVRGPDFMAIYAERSAAWHKAQAVMINKQVAEDVDDVCRRVLDGELTREQIMLTDDLFAVYGRYKSRVEDALAAAGQRRALKAAAKLQAGDFSTRVVFVTGPAGTGKTQWAMRAIGETITAAAAAGERWSMYRAATSNPLDDWEGQEVILLDDLRAASMTATEWLLLLDPYNASPASARYRNKGAVAPRLIVITASISPVEFFFYARQRGDIDEAMDQFLRRLSAVVEVVDTTDPAARYAFSLVGRTDRYDAFVKHDKADYVPVPWRTDGARLRGHLVPVQYGPVERVVTSAEGAAEQLVLLVAAGCSDLDLTPGGVIEGEVVEVVETV